MSNNENNGGDSRISRLDQNIVRYPKAIEDTYGEDGNLVLSVLSFLMSKFRTNMFNSVSFTLNEFCNEYGYHKNHICDKHSIFKENELPETTISKKKIIKPYKTKHHVWNSRIDHVLYLMMSRNIVYEEENYSNAKYLSSSRALNLIKKVSIRNEKVKGREEFVYEVTLGNEIFLNSLRWYISYKEQSFIELGKNKNGMGKRKLYLYFLTQFQRCLLSSIPSNSVNPNFNMLCTIANINHAQTRNNKQTLIKYLNIIGSRENLNFSHNLASTDLDHPDFLKRQTLTIVFNEIKHIENKKQADFFDDCIVMLQIPFKVEHYGNDEPEAAKDFADGTFTQKFQLWLNSDNGLADKVDIIKTVFEKNFKKEIGKEQIFKALRDPSYWSSLF
ncbi:MAG: hypothetical protein LBE82_00170 [Chitinophagaceae bacterium]|jgi:hypothetical protein|nr:hypothetical protein [Chitinophagaceae bacterium]